MITYKYPHDNVTVKAVHASYQEELFLNLLVPKIEKDAEGINNLFSETAENWAKQELGVLGFVSTYHMWERQLQELFLEQKEITGVLIPSINRKENIVSYAQRVLLEAFDASVSKAYWLELNKARIIVNAFKHGPSKKFEAAMKLYPEYFFSPEDNQHLPIVSVSLEQLHKFIKTVVSFWENLPRKIDYSKRDI